MTNPYREARVKTPNPHISRDELEKWVLEEIDVQNNILKNLPSDTSEPILAFHQTIIETLGKVHNMILQMKVEPV